MLKTEIDFGMKFFLVTLNGEVRDVGPNSEHPPVFQLVPFRPMPISDIHASVDEGRDAHALMEMESVEMGLEMGRNCATNGIFARPMSVAEVPECSVQMVEILWEKALCSSYSV